MLFIPLPLVVAILLLILFVTVVWRDDDAPPNVPFLGIALIFVGYAMAILAIDAVGSGRASPRAV